MLQSLRLAALYTLALVASVFPASAPPTVNTVSALSALAPGTYPTVQLLGYSAVGDGGGGLVNWVSSSTKTAAACSVYVPTSSPTIGRWERPSSPFRLAAQCGIATLDDTISGVVTYPNLAGSGSRMVVVGATGTASTQAIPSGSVANPTGTIGLTAVNGSATSAIRSDGAPALSQAIVPTWSGKHTFNDTIGAELGIRAGATPLSNVNLYRSAANMWKTDDSLTVAGNLVGLQLAGTGTRMVVADANGVTSTQSIPAGAALANPTGTIGLSVVNGVLTSGMRSDGAPALSQAIVPTWSGVHTFSAQPIFSTVTASSAAGFDASKGLISVAYTGTGNAVLSASPTFTGTIGAASQTLSGSLTVGTTLGVTGVTTLTNLTGSGTRMVVADPSGVISTQSIPSGSTLANPTATIGLTAVNGSATSGMRSDGAPALSQAIVPTWSGVHTFSAQPIFSTVTASSAAAFDASKGLISVANTGTGNNVLSASPTFTGTIAAASQTLSGSLAVGTTLGVTGVTTLSNLTGTGTRMVVSDASGVLSTQTIPAGGSLANPSATIGLTAVNGVATSGMRSDGAPALSQAIVPTWTGKHTFNDTVAGVLGFRAGNVAASNVNLYRASANMWQTDDSLTVPGLYALSQINQGGTVTFGNSTFPTSVTVYGNTDFHSSSSFSDNITASSSLYVGSNYTNTFYNSDATNAASNSQVLIRTNGASSGDPFVRYYNGIQSYSEGLDNSDNDNFKISASASLGTSDALVISTSGNVSTTTIFSHKATKNIPTAVSAVSGTVTFDLNVADFFTTTLSGNVTLAVSNASSGSHFTVRIKQDGTGGRTVSFPSTWRFPSSTLPTLTTTANGVDYLSFVYDEASTTIDFVGNALNMHTSP